MKRNVFCALLAALIFCVPFFAKAEGVSLAPYALTAPAAVTIEENEGSLTYVCGDARVVAMVIARVPDEDPADALPRLMTQFDPQAIFGADILLHEGFHGLMAHTPDRYGKEIDLHTAMILHEGDLLILSGYDMSGDTEAVEALLDALLAAITVDGMPIQPVAQP